MLREHKVIPFIDENSIKEKVKELGAIISKEYEGKELHVIGVLKGAWMFMADLVREINLDLTCDFITISSYGNSTKSSEEIQIVKDLSHPINGRDVLLVEDIIDTGLTINHLINMLKEKNPASIKLCSFLDKKERRVVDIDIDYKGFDVPDKFLVGYGLDYAQHYRNLKYIGYIEFLEKT